MRLYRPCTWEQQPNQPAGTKKITLHYRRFEENAVKAGRKDGCWNRSLVMQHQKKKRESRKEGPEGLVLTTLHSCGLWDHLNCTQSNLGKSWET